MNDYEFADSISADVGKFYGKAKSHLIVLPENSLIKQRSLTVVISNIIISCNTAEIYTREDLDFIIAKLKKLKLINFDIAYPRKNTTTPYAATYFGFDICRL